MALEPENETRLRFFLKRRKGGAERVNENTLSLCFSASLRFKKEPANSLAPEGGHFHGKIVLRSDDRVSEWWCSARCVKN